jgi:TetR/AcrR family transcriptional regulator, regulator of cefoperazone and chloramphenicol sensitivity
MDAARALGLFFRGMLESASSKVKLQFEFHAPRWPMARTRKYKVNTPRAIIEAAGPIFAERGFGAVTLKEIVAAAGVNSAAIHYHFGDKQGLYRAVIAHNLEKREEAAPIDTPDKKRMRAESRLRDFVHTLMIQLLDDTLPSVMSRLMLREAIDPTAEFDQAVDQLPRRQIGMLDAMIGELVGSRCTRAEIRRMSISVLGQCVYYRYAHKFLERIDPPVRYTRRNIEAIAKHIARFSLAAIRQLARASRARPAASGTRRGVARRTLSNHGAQHARSPR